MDATICESDNEEARASMQRLHADAVERACMAQRTPRLAFDRTREYSCEIDSRMKQMANE